MRTTGRVAILALAILLASFIPARAETAAACPVPDSLITELVGWIAANTSYDTAHTEQDLPVIETCAAGETVNYENENLIVDADLRGFYDSEARHIYLVEPWEAGNLLHHGVLLHELIHVVQLDNRAWECIGAPEWEAYKLQDAWLVEHGLDGDFDWLQIYFKARCPRDIHP